MIELDSVRRQLDARLLELTEKAHEIEDTLREPDSADSEERAVENEDDEVLEDMGNAALDEISQIKAALQRIEVGTYGTCTSCGEKIDERRLKALPFTANCIDCASEAEN